MIAKHYPELFADDPAMRAKAEAMAAKTHELVSFLTDVLFVSKVKARFEGAVTYHDSCSGLRELGVRAQPRKLLASVEASRWSKWRRRMSAAASAARSSENMPKSPTRSSARKPKTSRRAGRRRCWRAISAA